MQNVVSLLAITTDISRCQLCLNTEVTGLLIRSVPLSGNRLNYVSRFDLLMTPEVSWVASDQYLEHIKAQIDVELWFSWTPHRTVPSQLDVVSMDFLSLRGDLLAAGGSFHTQYSPKCNCGLGSMRRNRCTVALKHATALKGLVFSTLTQQSVL